MHSSEPIITKTPDLNKMSAAITAKRNELFGENAVASNTIDFRQDIHSVLEPTFGECYDNFDGLIYAVAEVAIFRSFNRESLEDTLNTFDDTLLI
jgi:hypothetical protein